LSLAASGNHRRCDFRPFKGAFGLRVVSPSEKLGRSVAY
jgi:hypothetical protein